MIRQKKTEYVRARAENRDPRIFPIGLYLKIIFIPEGFYLPNKPDR